ncbi:hypothetical protein Tco_0528217 [Tanacetum coccineum]
MSASNQQTLTDLGPNDRPLMLEKGNFIPWERYGGNGYRNTGRQNRNQSFNAGNVNDESNQIVQRVPRTESNPGKGKSMKDEAESNCNAEENDFMLDNSFGDETLEELIVAVIMMA